MLPGTPSGMPRSRRLVLAMLTVGVLVLTAVPIAQGASVGNVSPTSVAGSHSGAAVPPASHASVTAPSSTHMAASTHPDSSNSTNLTFYQNTTVNSYVAPKDLGCVTYNYTFEIINECYNWTVNPTLVPLGGSNVGVSFQYSTNQGSPACPSAIANYSTEVGFALSTNGGKSFGRPQMIMNGTCSYINSLEPSFAAAGDGRLRGPGAGQRDRLQPRLLHQSRPFDAGLCEIHQ
jgi:hypothetical protein